MFVIENTLGNGAVEYRCFPKQQDADKAWSIFVDQGRYAPGEPDVPQALIFFDTETQSVATAIKLVKSGDGKKIKRVAFSKSPELSKKVTRTGPGLIDKSVFENTRQAILDMADDFLNWTHDDLKKMDLILAKMGPNEPSNSALVDELLSLSYKTKSQGSTFGYQLVTIVSDRMCNVLKWTKTSDPQDEKWLQTLHILVDAIRLIITDRIKGGGGEVGMALIASIDELPGTHSPQN